MAVCRYASGAAAAAAGADAMTGGDRAGRAAVSFTTFIAVVIALTVFVVVAIVLAVALATILMDSPSNQSLSVTNTISSWMTTDAAVTTSDRQLTAGVSQRCAVFQVQYILNIHRCISYFVFYILTDKKYITRTHCSWVGY